MRKALALAFAWLLLSSCTPTPEPLPESGAPPLEEAAEISASPPQTEQVEETPPAVYVPDRALSVEETVEAYFEQQYLAYTTLTYIDVTSILYMEEASVRNSTVWSQMLAMRRRLLSEYGLCYVETESLPYSIRYISEDELGDGRLEYWTGRRPLKEGEITLHFIIDGQDGKAYPPFMAVNAQQSVRLMQIDGVWKISFHYFPGSIRKFVRGGNLYMPDEAEMLADLKAEFALADYITDENSDYDGEAAAEYALLHTENPNPDFYHIGDWMGNCANFTSQCVSRGFGDRMSDDWYAGEGGGSPAWENVGYFWEYITQGQAMTGCVLDGITLVQAGDLIQTSAGNYRLSGGDKRGDFSHSLIVANPDTLLLAQNTPGCFVYYSDVVNVTTRIVRPLTLIE